MRDHLTAADRLAPSDNKLRRAIAYLRARNRYCLDAPVRRVKHTERLSVLDRWLRSR